MLTASLLLATSAMGNGRFPRAQRLVQSETDPRLLALYGTYGLIVSSDAGASWNHVCEAATGTYTGEDPLLELLPDGEILARTELDLVKSAGSFCNWSKVRTGTTADSVQDITRGPSAPSTVLALVGAYDHTTGFTSLFSRSTDGGRTWSAERSLPSLVARGLSLDVAPSNPKRVVVSGLDSTGGGRLLVSDDGGGTWLGKVVTGTDSNAAPYLAAISKDDPDRIFVRTDSYEDANGIDTADDALLLTTDAGKTWSTVIQRNAKLFGFALSPDESTLLVGYGDPVVAATYVEPLDLGIYRADMATILADPGNAASHFEKIFDASVTCLRWTSTALFACTSQDELGFEVGRAPNAAFTIADPKPFTPLLTLPRVRPLSCAPGTDGYACYSDPVNGFPSVCGVFKSSCDASAPPSAVGGADAGPPGPSPGMPSSSVGGNGGAGSGAGGAGPFGGLAPSASGGRSIAGTGAAPSPSDPGASSCGCRVVGGGSRSRSRVAAVFLAVLAFVGRRRERVESSAR